jgi:tetratricopeptide (TPR) repeat protein
VRIGPCVPMRDYGDFLRRVQIYFRRGSKNDIATPQDAVRILAWFNRAVPPRAAYAGEPAWDVFAREVGRFDSPRYYVLVASELGAERPIDIGALGLVPWVAAFDFDPESDNRGLLAALKTVLQERRSIHIVTMKDRPTLNLRTGTYWYFVRGLAGREAIDVGGWREWQKQFAGALNEQLVRLAGACSPAPVTMIVLWNQPELLKYLRTQLESTLAAFGDLSNIVIISDDSSTVASVASDIGAVTVDMPLHHFCSGLKVSLAATDTDRSTRSIPTSSNVAFLLPAKDLRWLEEELELVALEAGQVPLRERDIGTDFLRGNEISWYELGIHSDVDRDLLSKVERQVRGDLESERTGRINLYHSPGAGGTTLAKRVLWDFHRDYPSVVLKSTNPPETAERLNYVASSSGKPVLVVVDGADVAQGQTDELYDQLRARHIPAVILQVVRRFSQPTEGQRSFFLRAELSSSEVYRFRSVYGKEQPACLPELDKLLVSSDIRYRTAFYFGLVAFEENFRGLEPHVKMRVDQLTPVQKKLLLFISLAHHYGQKPIPAQSFTAVLGLPKNRTLALDAALPSAALELLVRLESNKWRTVHDLVALEVLRQVLWPSSSDQRLWKQSLSQWAIEFAEFCRGSESVPSEEMLEVVRRCFVYRDNSELLGTERAGLNHFAPLIDDIPSREGALEVLRKLTDLYPDEAHFWAHLGRFHSLQRRDFLAAVECIDRALILQNKDHVLHHMRGMALRQQVYEEIEADHQLQQLIDLAKKSSESFAAARGLSPEDEHGYISEVQMLLRLLDYAGRKYAGNVLDYVGSHSADPFLREAFQQSEDLLERVRRNREGQGASQYEETCRAHLDRLYGRHDLALQTWDSLLSRKDTYAPPIRRQVVWTYLARRDRSWHKLDVREIDRIIDLLERNLREEPHIDSNLRLWVQAVRSSSKPPTIDSIIERVGYWRTNANSLEAVFYSYVLYALKAIEGSALAIDPANRFIEECRTRTRFNRNRTKSLEWLGKGTGVTRLVHHTQLGTWDRAKNFWDNTALLARLTGRIARIDAPQSGEIEIQGGLKAFFVPALGKYRKGRSENQAVSFYLGFSYEGLRGWEVRDA